jgi:hypothetical protein
MSAPYNPPTLEPQEEDTVLELYRKVARMLYDTTHGGAPFNGEEE